MPENTVFCSPQDDECGIDLILLSVVLLTTGLLHLLDESIGQV